MYLSSPPTRHGMASFFSISVCLCSKFQCAPTSFPSPSPFSPAFSLPLKSNFDPADFADLDVSPVSCLNLALTPWNCCPRHLCRILPLSLSFSLSCRSLFLVSPSPRPRPHTSLALPGLYHSHKMTPGTSDGFQ